MSYTVLHAGAFEDNYIWLIAPEAPGSLESRPVLIVDPGDGSPVFDKITKENLRPVAILCTHHHWDHVGGINEILQRYPVPVYGPAAERISAVTHPVNDADIISDKETGIQFKVLAVPGHTKGHIAYYGANMLFCGDTLFSAGCGRLFEGTAEQMFTSLGKLTALPDETEVYCAHEYTASNLRFAITVEPDNKKLRHHIEHVNKLRQQGKPSLPSTLELEKEINPFLRTQTAAIQHAVETHIGSRLEDEVAVFTELRRWKDHFRG
jgi:hydroxyacylglutathione hydrolase